MPKTEQITEETLQDLLTAQVLDTNLASSVLNMVLAAMLGGFVAWAYVRYGRSLSNRRAFAHQFPLLTMTTALVITIVQSNLALSLGMIGALSIVRFRAAIKEPEELGYLFLSIATGLGLGAQQRLLTTASVAVIVLVIHIAHRRSRLDTPGEETVFLTVSTNAPGALSLDVLSKTLSAHCTKHQLRRSDTIKGSAEATYLLAPRSTDTISELDSALREFDADVRLSFFENRSARLGT